MNNTSNTSFEQTPEQYEPVIQSGIDQNEISSSQEKVVPRNATFGTLIINEDIHCNLLSPQEKKLYQQGFHTLESLVDGSNNVERMVLTNPDMVSGIVGIQPLVSMKTGEAVLLYQSFKRAGNAFQNGYTFLEFGKERDYLKILVNTQAADSILRTHHDVLGIELPDRPMQQHEIVNNIIQLLNSSDARQANLAHGLLRGFPREDCQAWANRQNIQPNRIPQLKNVEDLGR